MKAVWFPAVEFCTTSWTPGIVSFWNFLLLISSTPSIILRHTIRCGIYAGISHSPACGGTLHFRLSPVGGAHVTWHPAWSSRSQNLCEGPWFDTGRKHDFETFSTGGTNCVMYMTTGYTCVIIGSQTFSVIPGILPLNG